MAELKNVLEGVMYYVYILQSLKDSKYYIGSSCDLQRRLDDHNSGKTISLRHRRPLKIVYTEEYDTMNAARKREGVIKRYKGGGAFKRLLNN